MNFIIVCILLQKPIKALLFEPFYKSTKTNTVEQK